MKIALNLSLFLFALVIWGGESFSITDYQMKRICKKEKKYLTCMKNLQKKRSNLQDGNIIEVPVIPYRR